MTRTTDRLVWSTLSDSGVPGIRESWGPEKCIPPLPYFTYSWIPKSDFADSGEETRYAAQLHASGADTETVKRFTVKVDELGRYIQHPATFEGGHTVFRFDITLRKDSE